MSGRDGLDDLARRLSTRLSSLSEEERQAHNASEVAEAERQHAQFKAAFDQGRCYICEKDLTTFIRKEPCLHWFLHPKGVKKDNFPAVAERFGMMSIQSWFRWVANEGEWAKNIADTAGEDHIVQVTARYGGYSWSISCGKTDFVGHGKNSNYPHYHLQMWIDGRPFIRYSDFHFAIHRDELVTLKAMTGIGAKSKFIRGESFDDLMAAVDPQQIIDLPVDRCGDRSRAPFKMDTMIIADEGASMSGEDIYNLMERAKAEGVTFASLAHTIPNSSAQTIISEGPGVVDPAPRKGVRGSKRDEI